MNFYIFGLRENLFFFLFIIIGSLLYAFFESDFIL